MNEYKRGWGPTIQEMCGRPLPDISIVESSGVTMQLPPPDKAGQTIYIHNHADGSYAQFITVIDERENMRWLLLDGDAVNIIG